MPISRTVLVFNTGKQKRSGTGFLLGPSLAVTARHVVDDAACDQISVLTSDKIEVLAPGQLENLSIHPLKVHLFSRDIALLEFNRQLADFGPSKIAVMGRGGQSFEVHIKGYAEALAVVGESQYIPVSKAASITADDVSGGADSSFTLQLRLFPDEKDYRGMSGAVLTCSGQPLALQTAVLEGPWPIFARLDPLTIEANDILSHHNIRKLNLPGDEPRLWKVEGNFDPPDCTALPVPIIEVDSESLDKVRTFDFAANDETGGFSFTKLDLDGLASGELKRVLIEAPAGFGKTLLLGRTAAQLSNTFDTFLVSCNRLTRKLETARANEILSQVVDEAISPEAGTHFKQSREGHLPRLLVLDGLNELGIGLDTIEFILNQAQVDNELSVLASQRPAITQAPPDGYVLGFLLPLDVEYVIEQLPGIDPSSTPLLRIPLFFELNKTAGIEEGTLIEAVRKYYVRCLAGLDEFRNVNRLTAEAQIIKLAPAFRSIGEAAVGIYSDKNSTAADEEFFTRAGLFSEIGGVDRALNAGFMVRDGGLIRFRHQLFHDWAVADLYYKDRRLLRSSEVRADLEVATLRRQSTDALELLVQRHAEKSPSDAEAAVLRIYDWDYPAAVASLISWRKAAATQFLQSPPRHLELAIYSLIAEKRFDLFQHTVRRFEMIRSFVDPLLGILLPDLPGEYSLDDLVNAIAAEPLLPEAAAWYGQWVGVFSGDMTFERKLALLQSDDGVLGWTASNVLARGDMGRQQGEEVVSLFTTAARTTNTNADRVATVGWRLVHATGRSPCAVTFLRDVAGDPSIGDDVRYGAIRSLFSIALTNDAETARSAIGIVSSLDESRLLQRPRVASAILRCCVPAPGILPPEVEYWTDSFGEMLRRYRDGLGEGSPKEVEEWTRRLTELETWKGSVVGQ